MKTQLISQPLFLALLVLAAAALAGCGSCKPGGPPGDPLAYNLTVAAGESLKGSSVIVDVVGVNPSELPRWQTKSLKDYFGKDDPLRADALKATHTFLPGQQAPFVLAKTNAIWKKWLGPGAGVQDLIIIADLPGVYPEGKVGNQDPRRQRIPLCKCYWPSGTKDLKVEVQAGGVKIVTLPREGYPPPPF